MPMSKAVPPRLRPENPFLLLAELEKLPWSDPEAGELPPSERSSDPLGPRLTRVSHLKNSLFDSGAADI